MDNTLYKHPEKELPYQIYTRHFTWKQEGQSKEKYEVKWVILTENTNSFIEELPDSYEGLSKNEPSIEEKGPLSIITVTYGDNELS